MRAFKKLFPASVLASALFLSACGQTATEPDLVPRNLTDASVIAEYCGDKAAKVAALVSEGVESKENSGKRKQLELWGLDSKNIEQIKKAQADVTARKEVPCGTDGKPAGLSGEQSFAAEVCLTDKEREALKPEGAKTTDQLKVKCREVGQATFDSLSDANKQQPTTKAYQKDLSHDSLNKVALATSYMKVTKQGQDNNVPPSDTKALADQIRAMFPNATADDLNLGADAVDHGAHKVEKGNGVFLDGADRYLKTKADIAAFLNSQDPKAVVAREHILKAAIAAGGEDERARVLTGEGFFQVQLKEASQILGTSYFSDGKVKILDQWRQSQPGDVYWLYFTHDVDSKGNKVIKLVPEATLRADCGNVNGMQIRIMKPGIPPAPSVTQPPGEEKCPPGMVMRPNGECKVPPPPVIPECQVNCAPPPPAKVCPPEMPHGTWPVCKDGVEQAPQNQGNLPQQQMPNVLPAEPQYRQPQEPVNPPAKYTPPPAAPAPQPAPVTQPGGTVIPAPSPNPPGPRETAAPEPAAPAPSEAPNTCGPAPGKTTC
jgi:hypothetical protein